MIESAREAVDRGDWEEACDLLIRADAEGRMGPAELATLGQVAYAAGRLDAAIDAWERAHAASMKIGDRLSAAGAAVRVAMHLLFDTALMAPVRGWVGRAEALLEGQPDAPPHAWVAVVRAYERILSGDLQSAQPWAQRAVELGTRFDPGACAMGQVAHARLRILDGEIEEGLALLNEVGVAVTSGDLDPLFTGAVYCELVCALQGLAQYDAAEQWTEAMERWSRSSAIGSMHGRCRVHRAEILRLRGACGDAEKEALEALEELRPYLRRELGWPLTELGRIRLRRGDLKGAEEALVAAQRAGWDAQPGLALVRLGQGDTAEAVTSIRDALERPLKVPSKERPPDTDLQRAPLLEAQVEIEIAAGNLGRARVAAEELRQIADRFRSMALAAGATLAEARVRLADGDARGAEQRFSAAVRSWTEIGAPYETALARLGLAEALRAAGSAERADLEQDAARAILDEIEAPGDRSGTPENVIRREGEYWSVRFDGQTVRMRDLKGIRYLARLLASPGQELHVLDLVAGESKGARPARGLGDAGEILDAQSREAYQRRLAEIENDIDHAQAMGDPERAAQAEAEREFLVQELSRALGLGGRGRRAGAASERARAGVTRAIRQAIPRLAEHHPELGEHLDRTIRTGTYCVYMPDPRAPVDWVT